MNRPLFLAPTSVEWDVVRGNHYIATPETFPEGCGIILEAASGNQWGVGKNRLGTTVKLRLYHPICSGCDEPIAANGLCDGCHVIHGDVA